MMVRFYCLILVVVKLSFSNPVFYLSKEHISYYYTGMSFDCIDNGVDKQYKEINAGVDAGLDKYLPLALQGRLLKWYLPTMATGEGKLKSYLIGGIAPTYKEDIIIDKDSIYVAESCFVDKLLPNNIPREFDSICIRESRAILREIRINTNIGKNENKIVLDSIVKIKTTNKIIFIVMFKTEPIGLPAYILLINNKILYRSFEEGDLDFKPIVVFNYNDNMILYADIQYEYQPNGIYAFSIFNDKCSMRFIGPSFKDVYKWK